MHSRVDFRLSVIVVGLLFLACTIRILLLLPSLFACFNHEKFCREVLILGK
jgi:hypothetical protein